MNAPMGERRAACQMGKPKPPEGAEIDVVIRLRKGRGGRSPAAAPAPAATAARESAAA